MKSIDHTPFPARHPAAFFLTVLAHAMLAIAWQAARHRPPPDAERIEPITQWLSLPAPARMLAPADEPATVPAPPYATMRRRAVPALRPLYPLKPLPSPATASAPGAVTLPVPAAPVNATGIAQDDQPGSMQPMGSETAATSTPPGPAGRILERARRDAGAVDRALRKENMPYIVAPPDSPQLRMRKGMEASADMAAPGLFEAPKVMELVNNTGNGDRRSKVVTGNGTYCITERAPTTRIDMIEKHGKQTFTTCPAHEAPATAQEWHSARD